MFESLSENYSVNVSDIIDLEQAYFVSWFTNAEAAINAFFSIFYAVIVYFHTPKTMETFKKLMLFYIANVMVVDIGAICLRFTLLMPFQIAFPLGVLGPLNVWQSFVAIYFTVFGALNAYDALITILLERHFQIASVIAPEQVKYRKLIYAILISTNLFIIHIAMIIGIIILPPEELAGEILRKYVTDVEILLNVQDSLLMLPDINPLMIAFLVLACFYMLGRVLLTVGVVFYTFYLNTIAHNNFSQNTKKGLSMMFRAVLIQFSVIVAFGLGPVAIGVFCFIFLSRVPQLLLLICGCLLGFYPTIEVCSSLIIIHPYRKAVLLLLSSGKIHQVPTSTLNIAASNNRINNQ